MSGSKRFFALGQELSIFKFTIDTRNIVSGATNGSENPLTYRIPFYYPTSNLNIFIIQVSDGRPDISFVGGTTNQSALTLTFATAGIYTITLLGQGRDLIFGGSHANAYDKLKLISIDNFGANFINSIAGVFNGCTNLIINAPNGFKMLGASGANCFNGIKGFGSNFSLSFVDISEATSFTTMLANVQNPLNSTLNAFINVATALTGLYQNSQFLPIVNKIEIISPSVTNVNNLIRDSNFQGRLIIKAPITNAFMLTTGIPAPISLGEVDIRKVASTILFSGVMSTTNVDATLLGWANNFDWTGVTTTSSFSFNNSKYSNNPLVIAAKTFLESKGMIFTNLTMV